jgi:hypothetical protein
MVAIVKFLARGSAGEPEMVALKMAVDGRLIVLKVSP